MSFDWDDLRYFLAVGRLGNVSAAARMIGADNATVVRRIDALERALPAKLFKRTPKGYELTQSGEKLFASASLMEAEAETVQARFGDPRDIGGLVTISSLEGFGNFFLAKRLPEFKRSYPRLRVELLTIQQIVALSRREADIAITVNPPATPVRERDHLLEYALHVYGTEDYLAKAAPIQNRDDLSRHDFCGYINDLVFTRGLDYLDEVAHGLRPALQSSSLHAQLEFVCAGYGLGVLPTFIARSRPELTPILPNEICLRRSYWLQTPRAEELSPAARAAIRFIKETAHSSAALFAPVS